MRNWFCSSSPTLRTRRLPRVVDVVGRADTVAKAQQVVDGSEDVIDGDGAADQNIVILAQQLLLLLGVRGGLKDLARSRRSWRAR